ncbi:MAG: glycosyltransferase family 39 protein [Pseudomonadota bacterium]|nr:glycosyltransferase family 39 protein [Pseudomonadota bacterium]
MRERKEGEGLGPLWVQTGRLLDERWRLAVVLAWLLFCAWFLYSRWANIQGFALGDTDDNLRMSQVRALLAGQDWFDLRQYRLNPPAGANVHWSRLVDLPLGGLILLLRPLLGGPEAERWAAAIAPLLPLLVMLFGVALTARRLIDKRAYLLAFIALFFAGSTTGMFMPLRIDHHGWQLALLSIAIAGIADRRRARGGATAGIASALSLTIGLELLIYLAILAAGQVLFWVADRDERRRLAAYGVSLAAGTAAGFLLFASYDNRQAVCDALSPVWLSDALLGGALLLGIALLSPAHWGKRLLLAALAGATVAGFHALAWPQCLSRLEGVSPEVQQLWLNRVREARPIYRHGLQTTILSVALPLTGLIGWAVLAWFARGDGKRFRRIVGAGAPLIAAIAMLLWQTRTGPAAQLIGAVGAAALVWLLVPRLIASKHPVIGIAASVVVALAGFGAAAPLIVDAVLPPKAQTPRDVQIGLANRRCNTMSALKPIAQQPKGIVFSFVDYGPRLITVTHHDAVTGPYHRNGMQIADVMKAFRGSEAQAQRILAKYRADYLLTCPNASTTTIFMAEAPQGFYGQISKGKVPGWLEPVPLPEGSPFRMWRVAKAGGSAGEAR